MRRAIWADNDSTSYCTKCKIDFSLRVFKHHCRKCGLIFCNECSRSKLLIPAEDIVQRPPNILKQKAPEYFINEDSFRAPKRVCDGCSHHLRPIQGDLRLLVSRAFQETEIDYDTKKTSVPQIDFFLENEIRNATLMLYHFKNTAGEEKIPKELLDVAKGVVFLTIAKCGFMFTARYGTGIVIAKLADGTWSAPSAITISGIGWGLQVGAELTDVMLILSSDAAVQAFMSKAQISVGAELGVSVGPVGRSVESDVTAGSKGAAHAFSYAHSKGLFFGASLETTAIAARNDVNRVFYGEKVKPSMLLSGEYPRPKGAEPLYIALEDMINSSDESNMPSSSSSRGRNGYDDNRDNNRGRNGMDDNYGNWNNKSGKTQTRERSQSPTPMQSMRSGRSGGGNQFDDFGLGYVDDEHDL